MFSKLTEAQKQFFETGRTRDLAFRICQLQLLADAMRKNETVLEEALKKDLGKSVFESYATEIGFVLADIRYTIQNLQKWSAPKRVRTPLYLFPGKSKIQKEPYGSVLILGPYNYPVQLLAEPLIGAIAAGNSNHQNLPHMFQKQCIRSYTLHLKKNILPVWKVEWRLIRNYFLRNLIISFLQEVNVSEGSL